jgi:hypothetical protein
MLAGEGGNMLYRIYTEDVDREGIHRILQANGIDGYTVIPARGTWEGKHEDSVVIKYAGEDSEVGKIRAASEEIRKHNGQQAVLVVSIPASVEIITGEREGVYA